MQQAVPQQQPMHREGKEMLKEICPTYQPVNIGLEKEGICLVMERLYKFTAHDFLLASKLHNYKWNVVGSNFFQLHKLFGELSEGLFEILDRTFKHIRELGARVPNVQDMLKIADVIEIKPGEWCDQMEMINCALKDYENILQHLSKCQEEIEHRAKDHVIADFVVEVEKCYRLHAYKLRSFVVAPAHHGGGGAAEQPARTTGGASRSPKTGLQGK
jgi:starvation-inducible DNA-binding protein